MSASNEFIPIYRPRLLGNEARYVNDCLDTSWISSKGRYISDFETAFARFVAADHATAVTNGTVALHLALLALGVGPGDEVLVPTLTYVASVNAISYVGATPVFVDCVPATWQLDPEDLARKLTPRSRAVMVVHLYGQACEMDTILAIASGNGLRVVEDCAEAFGTRYRDTHVGGFGDIATFSFYGNKTITCGEGGMVTTGRRELWDRVTHLKGQGVDPVRTYWHDVVGYNYRMTNIAAAIGLAQLERAEDICASKRELAGWYDDALRAVPVETHRESPGTTHSYWMYSVLVPEGVDRDRVCRGLAESGIETRPVFHPAHSLPMYQHLDARCPNAVHISKRGINLPSWPGLERPDVERIAGALASAIREAS